MISLRRQSLCFLFRCAVRSSLFSVTLLLVLNSLQAAGPGVVTFNDGATHVISDNSLLNNYIEVVAQSTLVIDPGALFDHSVEIFDGHLIMNGGEVSGPSTVLETVNPTGM